MSMPSRRLAFGAAAAAMVVGSSIVLALTMGSPTIAGAPVTAATTSADATLSASAPARPDNTFLIPHADGYGVADCLAGSSECGRIVANAWCESKGYRTAAAYGVTQASDITGSVAGRAQRAAEAPLYITCKR
jgi:hypothetical protein